MDIGLLFFLFEILLNDLRIPDLPIVVTYWLLKIRWLSTFWSSMFFSMISLMLDLSWLLPWVRMMLLICILDRVMCDGSHSWLSSSCILSSCFPLASSPLSFGMSPLYFSGSSSKMLKLLSSSIYFRISKGSSLWLSIGIISIILNS